MIFRKLWTKPTAHEARSNPQDQISTRRRGCLTGRLQGNRGELRTWKVEGYRAGCRSFVEASRRIIEKELTGKHTPITVKLTNFTDAVLTGYENATGDDS